MAAVCKEPHKGHHHSEQGKIGLAAQSDFFLTPMYFINLEHTSHLNPVPVDKGFEKVVGYFEKYISYALISIGLLFASYQVIELIYRVLTNLYGSVVKGEFYEGQHGMPLAALFFNILLLLEVLETVKTFSRGHIMKIKIILIVGIIAVTRKLLLADMTHAAPMEEIAVGIVILALSIGYFLVSKVGSKINPSGEPEEH